MTSTMNKKDTLGRDIAERGRNPLLDELGEMQQEMKRSLEVDMARTKTFFGMVIDGIQYLAIQAEGDLQKEGTQQARQILAHYFNMIERAREAVEPRTQANEKKILVPFNSNRRD